MARYLEAKAVYVIGSGSEEHRGVAVALAEAGARVAVGGVTAGDLSIEAALHSIANEIWALGRSSAVVAMADSSAPAFADALKRVQSEFGRADLVVRCDAVANA